MKQRIVGFDIARAFAIFGMVIVNFKIVMQAQTGNGFLHWFASLFEGRASALFVVLAGVGVTFLTAKARKSQDSASVFDARKTLIKRGLLLVVIGLAYTPVWPADILHFYGFYFFIAAFVFNMKDRSLPVVAALMTALFPILMIFFDYENGWDWNTLTYQGFWTMDGMFRHILFNGFHPVLPWCAFLILGMWLGRQDLSATTVRKKLLVWCLSVAAVTELTFISLQAILTGSEEAGLTAEKAKVLFSTAAIPPMPPMPPLPQYVIAAGSLAVVIVICCLHLSERFAASKLNIWLCQTGQLSLTLYVAHVIVGMGFLEAIGRLENQTIGFSLLSAFTFCIFGVIFSVFWLKHFQTGPLEWVFRKIVR